MSSECLHQLRSPYHIGVPTDKEFILDKDLSKNDMIRWAAKWYLDTQVDGGWKNLYNKEVPYADYDYVDETFRDQNAARHLGFTSYDETVAVLRAAGITKFSQFKYARQHNIEVSWYIFVEDEITRFFSDNMSRILKQIKEYYRKRTSAHM